MVAVAQSLHLASTAAFTLVAGLVALKLVRLSLRTGKEAERMLGLGILGTALLGYGLMMFGRFGAQAAQAEGEPVGLYMAMATAGWVFHNLGVMCMLRFIVVVFRPREGWASALALAMTAVLWVGWIGYLLQGGVRDGVPSGFYWLSFSAIGTYHFWAAIESFRYHGRMRRRLAMGLADALVTDRFRLWGIASLCGAASIWIVNVPGILGVRPSEAGSGDLEAVCLLLTACFGILTVATFWLTFFPPRWYRRRHEGSGGAAAEPA